MVDDNNNGCYWFTKIEHQGPLCCMVFTSIIITIIMCISYFNESSVRPVATIILVQTHKPHHYYIV